MDDADKMSTLKWYEELEQDLLDYLRYVPYSPTNLAVHSPRLANVVVNACGLLDSILREISLDPSLVGTKQKSRRDLDIADYAQLYGGRFQLPTLKSILLLTPPKYLVPFNNWERFVSGLVPWSSFQPPQWWSIHNKLKHDWIPNVKTACLEVALESMCALHQIISCVPEFAGLVLRQGWVPGKNLNPEMVIQILDGSREYWGALLVETQLFVVARGNAAFPDKIEDFKPAMFNASERLIDFFGRWY